MTHLALVGPTASGKSDLALAAAHALGNVEIVSVDSMQVYRGLDIGTGKPTARERATVPHHLIDVADPSEDWSVARFQAAARDAVADIDSRGKHALLVGGTGLYLQAVIDPLSFPPEDLSVRAECEAEVSTPEGLTSAYAELERVDPVAAARIEPGNARRIVRALEVMRITGQPFSSFGPGIQSYGDTVFSVSIVGLSMPSDVLARRIEQRFAAMREAGLVEEVRALAAHGALSRSARQAIGYKEVLAYLEGSEPSLDAALDEAVRHTLRFARRQVRWFRRDPRITWVEAGENPCDALPSLLALWSR
ncbi:MAG: tRNA (adenosine(37)-N6)-dimethylallyltransferase MiaA [Acidimicrobiia bacterium]